MDSRHRLLVVDDEPHNRDLLRRLLQAKYEVEDAGDAEEAIEILEASGDAKVDLIISDHLMPGKTGAQLASIVAEKWPGTPFLLLTGYDGDKEVSEAAEKGFIKEVLSKPWRGRDLRATIASTLDEQ